MRLGGKVHPYLNNLKRGWKRKVEGVVAGGSGCGSDRDRTEVLADLTIPLLARYEHIYRYEVASMILVHTERERERENRSGSVLR